MDLRWELDESEWANWAAKQYKIRRDGYGTLLRQAAADGDGLEFRR